MLMSLKRLTKMDYIALSKEISYALRHAPWKYELEMNHEGFVELSQLLFAINEEDKYPKAIDRSDIIHIMEISEKKRLEIEGEKIRALYGHSIPMHIKKEEGMPPDILYHGTAKIFLPSIMESGLLPMSRQYVHLSSDIQTALQVGKRRDSEPAILRINAKKAFEHGIKFYIGNDKVWLCDRLPSEFLFIDKE